MNLQDVSPWQTYYGPINPVEVKEEGKIYFMMIDNYIKNEVDRLLKNYLESLEKDRIYFEEIMIKKLKNLEIELLLKIKASQEN